jgi:hypothetical protein
MAFWNRKESEPIQDFEPEKGDFKPGISLREIANGQVLNNEYLRKNRKYLLYMVFLAFLYINNHYGVDALLKEHQALNKEVQELKYEAITTSSQLMQMSKQSEVVRRVQAAGLDLDVLTTPPRILK